MFYYIDYKNVIIMSNSNNIAPINEKLNIAKCDIRNIKCLIYTVREKQVMLDNDIANLYEVQTKRINFTIDL